MTVKVVPFAVGGWWMCTKVISLSYFSNVSMNQWSFQSPPITRFAFFSGSLISLHPWLTESPADDEPSLVTKTYIANLLQSPPSMASERFFYSNWFSQITLSHVLGLTPAEFTTEHSTAERLAWRLYTSR